MKSTNRKIESIISKIDAIYISGSYCEMMNEQSCDCDNLIIDSGHKHILLTSEAVGEDGRIVFEHPTSFDKALYPYEVELEGAQFTFDKFSYLENGMIDGIRFAADGVFLFVFALDNNIVLTMSKYDIFEEIEMDLPENEAVLKIRQTK